MTNKVYADRKGPSYDYDAYGRLVKRTWARGVETIYTYDDWGALTRTDYSDDKPSVALSYNAIGRQMRAIDAAGTTTFAYDTFGSLTNETVGGVAGTNMIERFYDSFGRDAGYALNGVRQSTLGYNPATGRLATMLAARSETPFTWNYLAASSPSACLLPDAEAAEYGVEKIFGVEPPRDGAERGRGGAKMGCGRNGAVFGKAIVDFAGFEKLLTRPPKEVGMAFVDGNADAGEPVGIQPQAFANRIEKRGHSLPRDG